MFQSKVDNYIELKNKENQLAADLKAIAKERKELMEELSAEMDAQGVTQLQGVNGAKVSLVHTTRTYIRDFEGFRRWCADNGKTGEFLREQVRMGSKDSPGLNQWLEAGNEIPIGAEQAIALSLRVNKPKDNGFSNAGKSVLERLKERVDV
jgi:hypothetical protein